MAKKTPTMLKRLKRKLKKEDVTKYGTAEEIKLLEADDPFEIPVIGKPIEVDSNLLKRVFDYLSEVTDDDSEEFYDMLSEFGNAIGYDYDKEIGQLETELGRE